MSLVYALKLARVCPHCGEQLVAAFKRDVSKPEQPLLAAVSHGIYDPDLKWEPVTGFEDAMRLEPRISESEQRVLDGNR